MSPRIIHIPLSGGDRKAQAKGIRYAHGIHETYFRESILIRSAAEAKIREADRLECEAWNAIMWAGGPAMPSPGDPQVEPMIGKAINGGYDLLEAKCNRCDRVSLVPLQALKQPLETPVWKLEAALYCEPCSEGRHYSRRQRAHVLGLTYVRPAGSGATEGEPQAISRVLCRRHRPHPTHNFFSGASRLSSEERADLRYYNRGDTSGGS
jgi:hypothetical protein